MKFQRIQQRSSQVHMQANESPVKSYLPLLPPPDQPDSLSVLKKYFSEQIQCYSTDISAMGLKEPLSNVPRIKTHCHSVLT